MSDVLAIVGPFDTDEELLEQIARRRPDRVTVLLEDESTDLGSDESSAAGAMRDRLAAQIAAHPLHREITATVATNDLVNRAGITFVDEMRTRTSRTAPEAARGRTGAAPAGRGVVYPAGAGGRGRAA